MTWSGWAASARVTPGRPRRGFFGSCGRFGFRLWEALGGRRARVARRLARRVEPGFQLREPCLQRTDLHSLRLNLHPLRQDQDNQVALGKSFEDLAIHRMR